MGKFAKFTDFAGFKYHLNMDKVFRYSFVHASPNSSLIVYSDSSTTFVTFTIPEADARKLETNLLRVYSMNDFDNMTTQGA